MPGDDLKNGRRETLQGIVTDKLVMTSKICACILCLISFPAKINNAGVNISQPIH